VSPALASAPGLSTGSCSTRPRNDHRHHRSTVTRPPRVLACRGQPSANASREVSPFPFSVHRPRRTVREVPTPRTIPLRRFPSLGTHASAGPSLRFFRLASRFLSLRVLRRRPRGSFVGDVFRPRTGPATRAVIATWPGVLPPGDAPGISHSLRSVDPTRGWPRLIGMTGPTCRFPVPPAASFIVAGPRAGQCAGHGWRGRGSWASRRSLKSAVPCHPPTPPWLLCTGSFVLTGQDCPGILLSSLRSSASRLRSPLLKTIPPGLLEPPLATSLQR